MINHSIQLPNSEASHGRYDLDRVTDNRAQFELRWNDCIRANSPRQRRIKAKRMLAVESRNELLSAVGGILLLAVIIICLFFI